MDLSLEQFSMEMEKQLGKVHGFDDYFVMEMHKTEVGVFTDQAMKNYNGSLGHEANMTAHFVKNKDLYDEYKSRNAELLSRLGKVKLADRNNVLVRHVCTQLCVAIWFICLAHKIHVVGNEDFRVIPHLLSRLVTHNSVKNGSWYWLF